MKVKKRRMRHTRCKTGDSAHQSDPTRSTPHNKASDTQNVGKPKLRWYEFPRTHPTIDCKEPRSVERPGIYGSRLYDIRSWKDLSQTTRGEYTARPL